MPRPTRPKCFQSKPFCVAKSSRGTAQRHSPASRQKCTFPSSIGIGPNGSTKGTDTRYGFLAVALTFTGWPSIKIQTNSVVHPGAILSRSSEGTPALQGSGCITFLRMGDSILLPGTNSYHFGCALDSGLTGRALAASRPRARVFTFRYLR